MQPDPAFIQNVGDAFKNCHSILALSRSPLAAGSLVQPTLVLDDLAPTPDERGQGLRLALQWAVEQLAPGPIFHPVAGERPLDDPTWRDPRWWRYNILRHRYLEPLHPDDFVEGGRFTETLLALTGIPTADIFFDERNRAIREVGQWLQRQTLDHIADEPLRQMALETYYRRAAANPGALALLGVASTFNDVFPRRLLLALAREEHLSRVEAALHELIAGRLVQSGDGDSNLWVAPIWRRHVAARQPVALMRRRNHFVARAYRQEGDMLTAIRHFQEAGEWEAAAGDLLGHSAELRLEAPPAQLLQVLRGFRSQQVSADRWRDLQLLLSDLLVRSSLPDEALAALREALKATTEAEIQARIYRRMGKLYEEQNQLHAFSYYQLAVERFSPTDPEFAILLKDRGWLYTLRREWEAAQADLEAALSRAPTAALHLRADVLDALSSLQRGRDDLPAAISQAQAALSLREQAGDPLGVAKSFNTLGILYRTLGDFGNAIAAYDEAIAIYRRLDNQALIATALLNIGAAHHFAGDLSAAQRRYRECLSLCQEVGLPLTEVRAHSNLCEVFLDQGQTEAGRDHWRMGHALSVQSGFDDEVSYFRELCGRYPPLAPERTALDKGATHPTELDAALSAMDAFAVGGGDGANADPDEQAALEIVRRDGSVSVGSLRAAIHVSKATATRKLVGLAERGLLEKRGQARSTFYVLARPPSAAQEDAEVAGRLVSLESTLGEQFGVRLLRLSSARRSPEELFRVVDVEASFRSLPDLRTFFALEAEISVRIGRPVNLTLVDEMG